MTNEELFLESVFNKKHRVYGFELKTLTLFHLGLLNALKNPIITGDRVKPKDVMSAALICSSTNYDDFIRRSKGFAGYFMPLFNFEKQLSSFFAYYEDHMSLPNSLQTESSGKANPFPYVLTFLAKTIKETGYTFEYVFYKMPVGLIVWLNSTFSYLESGETDILDDKENQFFQELTK